MGRKSNQRKDWTRINLKGGSGVEERLKEKLVKKYLGISGRVIEYHYVSYNKLNLIITTLPSLDKKLTPMVWQPSKMVKTVEKLFNKKVNIYWVYLGYPNLDAQILAEYIRTKISSSDEGARWSTITDKISHITDFFVDGHLGHAAPRSSKMTGGLQGVRVEVKGWPSGSKMGMSKKIIKNVGRPQRGHSSNSIIEYGFAKSLNKKGITGIKVWINYTPVRRTTL